MSCANKRFLCSCVGSGDGAAITAMVDASRQITRRTFLSHVDRDEMDEMERALLYATGRERGLRMSADFHVSYHRSSFRGRPCVYFRHSAIEYIFV